MKTLQHCSHTFLKKRGFKIYHSKNSHLRLILTTPFFLVIVQTVLVQQTRNIKHAKASLQTSYQRERA